MAGFKRMTVKKIAVRKPRKIRVTSRLKGIAKRGMRKKTFSVYNTKFIPN